MKNYLLLRNPITVILFFITSSLFSQDTVTVTDCNLQGWLKQPIGNSSLGFINGPEQPSLGKGSLKFNVPSGGIFWPGDFVRFRNGQYSGTPLSSLTALSYETFIEARDTIADVHFLVVLVDVNGDATAEHNLVFDPRYQNPKFIRSTMPDQGITKENVWQKWDCLNAGWFYGGTPDTDPDHNGPYFTLSEYLAQYPQARIMNDPAKGGPAIRLTAGGVVFKPNFFGSVDAFTIGVNGVTTIYDFEFTIANAGDDKHIMYGYGSPCVTLNGAATGGIAPYSFLWSPGGDVASNSSINVCPSSTNTYTLTVTDANGCKRTDDITVFVNDVRCGVKMDKVKICHKGHEICVDGTAVQAHLIHGDMPGSCPPELITKNNLQSVNETKRHLKINRLTNYPNPFNSFTRVEYELPFAGTVSLKVFDLVSGKEITTLVNGNKAQGLHSVNYNTKELQAGVYSYRLVVSSGTKVFTQTHSMVKMY